LVLLSFFFIVSDKERKDVSPKDLQEVFNTKYSMICFDVFIVLIGSGPHYLPFLSQHEHTQISVTKRYANTYISYAVFLHGSVFFLHDIKFHDKGNTLKLCTQ